MNMELRLFLVKKLLLISYIAYTNVAFVITLAAARPRPIVIDNEIKIREIANVTVTIDSRFTNGVNTEKMYKKFCDYLKNPEEMTLIEESNLNAKKSLERSSVEAQSQVL